MNSMVQRTQRKSTGWVARTALLMVGLALVGTPQNALAQWSACGSGDTCLPSGNAGIGTTGPGQKLEVTGNALISGSYSLMFNNVTRYINANGTRLTFATDDSAERMAFQTNSQERISILSNGNVGIGTATPTSSLHVASFSRFQDFAEVNNGIGMNAYYSSGWKYRANGSVWALAKYPDDKFHLSYAQAGTAGDTISWNYNGLVLDPTNGNVGIGTTSPTSQLTLGLSGGGDGVISRGTSDGSDTGRLSLASGGTIGADRGAYIELLGNEYGIPSIRGTVGITAGGSTGDIGFSTGFVGDRMIIKNNGKVGIGVSDPYALFTIKSWNMGTTPTLAIMPSSAQTANIIDIYDPLTQQLTSVLNAAGNLGIGTTNPTQALTVSGNGVVRVFESATTSQGRIEFGNAASHYVLGETGSGLRFVTGASERVRIDNTGNVGIGTTTPSTKLHVVGDVTVTGNIAAKYQDVAEWVPASQPLEAGTVVMLDMRRTNGVLPSELPYDTRVAGVVSATPGLLLGEAGAGKVKVATTGRVKAKVDATKKPIQVGDLLVTSEKAGLAMASEPTEINGRKFHQPGTILGKALEPLKEGEGEILVLLSLQ